MKKNRNEANFSWKKNRNKRQPDNLSGIENKDKSKAQLSLGLSRIVDVKKHVIWQSLLNPLSPHFMRAEAALGVDRRRGQRDKKQGTQLNLDLGPNEEDGAEGVLWQSLQSQISIPGLGQRERWWRAGKEEGQIVIVSYLCSDLVWPRATWPWHWLSLTENEKRIIS